MTPSHAPRAPHLRLLALPLLVLAACGLAPEADFSGVRAGDGVAAWEDLGALEICLANDRIGPPSAGAGGFCVDRNTPNEANCQDASDCRSRELCVCGRCTVAYCSSNAECPPELACSSDRRCSRECGGGDADCGPGELCAGGFCRGRCSVDGDCQTAEVCSSNGRCVVAGCGDDGDCLDGEICKVQRQPRATAEPSPLFFPQGGAGGAPEIVLYLEMSDAAASTRAIYRAESKDGLHFRLDPAEPVLEEVGGAFAPSVVATPTGLVMYYESTLGIRRSESQDGRLWSTAETVLMGDFHSPGAYLDPAGDEAVFVHTGARAGLYLFRPGAQPSRVLAPTQVSLPELWRDVVKLGAPFALLDDSLGRPVVRVWFDAFGAESGDSLQFGEVVPLPPNDSVGYAAAPADRPDHLEPYAYNPIFDRVQAFLDHRAEREPAALHLPGLAVHGGQDLWLLYYRGEAPDGSSSEGVGVARNPPRVDEP